MNKKDYPYQILQQLNSLKKEYPKNCSLTKVKNALIRYDDKDEQSKFFFQINSFTKNQSGFYYSVSFKPRTADLLEDTNSNLKYHDLVKKIKEWSSIIEKFDTTDFFEEDPITSTYEKEYFEEYKILDEDADRKPFDIKQQLLIDKYLEESVRFLDKYEKKNPDFDLTEPKELATSLKSELTSLTKNEVIKKLSGFWAVSRKKGLPILKEVFFKLAKEIINGLGKDLLGM